MILSSMPGMLGLLNDSDLLFKGNGAMCLSEVRAWLCPQGSGPNGPEARKLYFTTSLRAYSITWNVVSRSLSFVGLHTPFLTNTPVCIALSYGIYEIW